MTALTHPRVSLKTAKGYVIRCIQAGVVPFLQGNPGIAKSAMTHAVAADGNLQLIDLRLSQCAPEDLQGLPMKVKHHGEDRSSFVPFTTFPLEGDPLPPGKDGWLLFLDEFNSSSKSVQAAAYKLVLDRKVGERNLHPKVAIVCAGNLATDKAIVNQMSTAMQSRLVHLIVEANKDDWIEWATSSGKIDYRVIGFIEFQPHKLHMFKPDHQDLTFACPRTWEFASKLIQNVEDVGSIYPLLAGTLSPGVALEFRVFCEEYTKIPKISTIIMDPKNVGVPQELSTRFAVLTMLMSNTEENNIKPLVTYVTRFQPEEQLIYFRGILNRNADFRELPEVQDALMKVMTFVNSN